VFSVYEKNHLRKNRTPNVREVEMMVILLLLMMMMIIIIIIIKGCHISDCSSQACHYGLRVHSRAGPLGLELGRSTSSLYLNSCFTNASYFRPLTRHTRFQSETKFALRLSAVWSLLKKEKGRKYYIAIF